MVYLPHWPIPHVKTDIMLGLDRVQELLARLGNPQNKLPPVIHVAGTNGKGSTVAYLKSIFEHSGYKVHRYISPHLSRFNERIMLSGQEITDSYLYEIMEETRLQAEGVHTTFFEATTAAAFLAFSRAPADVLLLEVGMGGRMDATNVIDNPLLSVITPISFDHVEYLGDTIAKIAYEKAGIIKPGCPCVSSWQMSEALEVIEQKCQDVSAELFACGRDWNFEVNEAGFIFHDFLNKNSIQMPHPSLLGLHQIVNASAAVASCMKYLSKSFDISTSNIQAGLANTFWPARMQKITSGTLYQMLPEGFELWVDGAHNTGGAQMISATIANLWQDKPTYLINGRTGERDIKGFLEYFKGIVKLVCGVKVVSEPKGEKAENIAAGARELGFEAYACDSLSDAVKLIISKADRPSRILIAGSLYLASDVSIS
ncbi:MAG: bifunctional folylpolyglutamate synthase/dihydrofolate synthase [Candidatus Jidaibacter sp.]|jgi:dihydrofolate synthase/folylpolyglutamate synthase|nr:bifunctional folylpolyglutamate synthase/dihydrofolate synthase [Candidatus Jidaibacter sp.]